jgi:hypothetical protein
MTKVRYISSATIAFILVVYATACNQEASTNQEIKEIQTDSTHSKVSLEKGKLLFETNCKICHMLPEPQKLPKNIWGNSVLPLMATYMGLKLKGIERVISAEEKEIEDKNNLIPIEPMIDLSEYEMIKSYILSAAPETIPYAQERLNRNKPLSQFTRRNIPIDAQYSSLITGLRFNTYTKTLWVANLNNKVLNWKWNKGVVSSQNAVSAVVDFTFYKNKTYFTHIGSLFPSELSKGLFTDLSGNGKPILTHLHRPVNSLMDDLNHDGIPEILVANFGKNFGSLSLFKKTKQDGYVEDCLLAAPGAVKLFFEDMNKDGLKDIIALFAQADESVYIFFQKPGLKFEAKRVLRFPPVFGSIDMIMVDYNKDGLTDIVTANGDNADYSIVLKNYHGIRIHLNKGNNIFEETFFYPVYGATKVLAEDFDKDGDIDFAINCFYPDFGVLLPESFVYLQNDVSNQYVFSSYIHQSELPVKSLTLEKGDIDDDGDIDIILGNFSESPAPVPANLKAMWKQANYGLIIFENRLK